MLNNHQLGCRRDRQIIDTVNEWRILDTDMIRLMFFSSLRMAQKRLQVLHERKKLHRLRYSIDRPYEYFLNKRPTQAEHLLGVNWTRLWLQKKCLESLIEFNYEVDYKILRCDGFAVFNNSVSDTNTCYFIELDRSDNCFDKIKKYNELYSKTHLWESESWVSKAKHFPIIVIVTESESRLKHIRERMQKENTNNLDFRVYLLDKFKEGLLK